MSLQKSKLNKQILEEAAEWLVEMDRDDVDRMTRQRFDEWLRLSPEHVRAFLELLPIWEQGAQHRSDKDPARLIAEAMGTQDNVVLLNARPVLAARPERKVRAKFRTWVSIAASAPFIALGIWLYSQHNTYATGIGEQRSIALGDGSVVELNTRSRVRIRYSEQNREIELLDGQALFDVAHDKNRPFVVHDGDARIRAIGTQFDVYRKRSGTTVTVVEGRVTILPAAEGRRSRHQQEESMRPRSDSRSGGVVSSARQVEHSQPAEIVLTAGEQATVSPGAVQSSAGANVAAAIAWTQRRLMFQKTTLAEVIGEFNRYNERPVRIVDPQIQGFLVSGTFSSTDPSSLLRFLREQPGMRVVENRHEVRIERAP
jgi:transmembrane sensor